MPLIFQTHITRDDLRHNRHALYIFGDNLARTGLGGQAAAMRGEPNAIGLPTKRSPSEFLHDSDLPGIMRLNATPIETIISALRQHKAIIWPRLGIGTGFAQLELRAPQVAAYYTSLLEKISTVSRLNQ